MKWNDLTGEERYRVVELARKGETPIREICEAFGVTRQTLTKAITAAEEAMKATLEPKKPGRKSKSEEALKIIELSKKQSSLEKDVEQWKTRYEVAQAYIDIVHDDQEREARSERNRRKRERQKSKKKPRSTGRHAARATGSAAGGPKLAVINGGAGTENPNGEPAALEKQSGKTDE